MNNTVIVFLDIAILRLNEPLKVFALTKVGLAGYIIKLDNLLMVATKIYIFAVGDWFSIYRRFRNKQKLF